MKNKNKLFELVEKGLIPMFVCFDPDSREIVYIWEESPDRRHYRTEINGKWISIENCHLIRYRHPEEHMWLSKSQKESIYKSTEEMMRGCKNKKSKLTGEYIIESVCPIRYWIELQEKLNKERNENNS